MDLGGRHDTSCLQHVMGEQDPRVASQEDGPVLADEGVVRVAPENSAAVIGRMATDLQLRFRFPFRSVPEAGRVHGPGATKSVPRASRAGGSRFIALGPPPLSRGRVANSSAEGTYLLLPLAAGKTAGSGPGKASAVFRGEPSAGHVGRREHCCQLR